MDTISALRTICTNCTTTDTDKWIGPHRFEARALDRTQSVMARRGILDTSEVISKRLVSVFPNALDGHEWKFEEFVAGNVQSRSTGGLGKFECGFDPQTWRKKVQTKRQQTERMYIHREECMLNYIGSTLQAGHNSAPIYIQNNQNLITVAESRSLIIDLLINDFRSMARAIDGTTVLGNFAGESEGNIVNNGVSQYPHFDGVIKQTLLQANASYFAAVDVTVTNEVGGDAFFVKVYGDFSAAYTTIDDMVTGINALVRDTDGESLFSASRITTGGADSVVRIAVNEVEQPVYGEDALKIYYSATGTLADCDAFEDATVVQNPMGYAEEPLLFDYSDISTVDFYDYFKTVSKEWRKKMVRLHEDGQLPTNLGSPYIAIDPLLLIDKDFALIEKLGTCCETGERQINLIDNMLPRFEGLKVLEGTGLWFMTFNFNVIYLTNLASDALGVIKTWHDNDCDKVKGRLEMLGNVLVLDFAMMATNAKGSSFENSLKDAYQPENLPHLCQEVRQNCVGGDADTAMTVQADVCATVDTVLDTADITLTDDSIIPTGDSIATVVWTFYDAAGNQVVPALQTTASTINTTNTIYSGFTVLTYQVTTANGLTNTITIPVASIGACA